MDNTTHIEVALLDDTHQTSIGYISASWRKNFVGKSKRPTVLKKPNENNTCLADSVSFNTNNFQHNHGPIAPSCNGTGLSLCNLFSRSKRFSYKFLYTILHDNKNYTNIREKSKIAQTN